MLNANPQMLHPHAGPVARLDHWTEAHNHGFLEVGRIILGLFLLEKGLYFLSSIHATAASMTIGGAGYGTYALAHYIVWAHLVGGIMLVLGFWTRPAALVQLPILIGAVLLSPVKAGSFVANGTSVPLAAVTLAVVCIYLVLGAGTMSVDHYLATHDGEERPQHKDFDGTLGS